MRRKLELDEVVKIFDHPLLFLDGQLHHIPLGKFVGVVGNGLVDFFGSHTVHRRHVGIQQGGFTTNADDMGFDVFDLDDAHDCPGFGRMFDGLVQGMGLFIGCWRKSRRWRDGDASR